MKIKKVTATNHALTGAAIGLAIGNPWIAIPVALVSHFLCDAIPHFGMGKDFIRSNAFRNFLLLDTVLCISLVLFLGIAQPTYWLLAAACAFVAASPDLLWIPLYRRSLQGKEFTFTGFHKFAANIQWFERPVGSIVELVWLFAAAFLVGSLVLY